MRRTRRRRASARAPASAARARNERSRRAWRLLVIVAGAGLPGFGLEDEAAAGDVLLTGGEAGHDLDALRVAVTELDGLRLEAVARGDEHHVRVAHALQRRRLDRDARVV